MRIDRSTSYVVLAFAMVVVLGCDSPGGADGPSVDPSMVAPNDSSDTSPPDATSQPETTSNTAPDTRADIDTAVPSLCELGCIPVVTATAPRGVVFQQYPSGAGPVLTGGAAPTGDWVLDRIEVRPNQTFADGIDVQLANAGQTAGRSSFGGDAMAMAIDLHLSVTVTVLGSSGTDTARQEVAVGGCHAISGTTLTGSLDDCASGFPPGTAPPYSLDFEHDSAANRLTIGLTLSRESLIALLPEDQRESGELAITGPLYLVARFTRP